MVCDISIHTGGDVVSSYIVDSIDVEVDESEDKGGEIPAPCLHLEMSVCLSVCLSVYLYFLLYIPGLFPLVLRITHWQVNW